MPFSMHAASAPVFTQMLTNLLAWLDKAEAHAAAKKFDANKFVGMRLTPDMLPFERQIQIATDHVKGCLARLAGQEPPKWADDEKTLAELRSRRWFNAGGMRAFAGPFPCPRSVLEHGCSREQLLACAPPPNCSNV